ncbi:P-loop containing nucleoside triphosphate hydrolase protein [Thozetella sp. PMI_491]|nr:P-loop containing nucleoside triphosphate hydrolase protein [Thozetella sp. PMI_491]
MAAETEPTNAPVTSKRGASKKTLRVDEIYSRKDRQKHYVATNRNANRKERFGKYTLVVRRVINELGIEEQTEVDVNSKPLAKVIREILKGTKYKGLRQDPPYFSPRTFFHIAPILRERSAQEEGEKEPDTILIADIKETLSFVDEEFKDVATSIASLQEHGEITYDLLWSLFPPNCAVVFQTETPNENQAVKFSQGTYVSHLVHGDYYVVEGMMINHDGSCLGWGTKSEQIHYFNGTQPITSLPIFPLKFHPQRDAMEREFRARGKSFLQLMSPICKEYEGMAFESEFEFDKWVERQMHVTGRIMVDPVAFRMKLPNNLLLKPRVTDEVQPKNFKEDDLVFCNHRALGFSFEAKKWGAFLVSGTREVVWDKNAINSLILGEKRERLITSLVLSHSSGDESFDDFIKGKGKGLVGLLSGPPGVGKTLTAEVVAELSCRPLYVVTAGELGITSVDLDAKLANILSIIRRWGCVLLIDEADIFLRKRADGQMEQNALVSVFLRRLEYFHGIIILTTNRAQDIDQAFKSRIHFSFNYPPLGEKDRLEIWKNFLKGIPNKDQSTELEENLQRLAKLSLNGREIKNTISCALAVAKHTGEPLSLETIDTVLDAINGPWEDPIEEDLI